VILIKIHGLSLKKDKPKKNRSSFYPQVLKKLLKPQLFLFNVSPGYGYPGFFCFCSGITNEYENPQMVKADILGFVIYLFLSFDTQIFQYPKEWM
jgi:hypothetical protein